jgi:hypothetical protein
MFCASTYVCKNVAPVALFRVYQSVPKFTQYALDILRNFFARNNLLKILILLNKLCENVPTPDSEILRIFFPNGRSRLGEGKH